MWPNWSVSGSSAPTPPQPFDFSEPFRVPLKPKSAAVAAVMTSGGDGESKRSMTNSFTFEKPPSTTRLLNGRRSVTSSSSSSTSSSPSSSSTSSSVSSQQYKQSHTFIPPTNPPVQVPAAKSISLMETSAQKRADSSSNSILAALKSLGPNNKLNSIFVKPKSAKHIGLS